MPDRPEEPKSGVDGYLFRLIATFEAAAMQQLGKIAHPVTGDVEVSLEGASDSIEMLAMVSRKTEGNLNDDEKRLLEHVLYQLRMNYVDVARAETEAGGEGAGARDEAAEPEGEGPESRARGAEPEGERPEPGAERPEPELQGDAGETKRDDDG
jgi:hypothetical protein